MAGETFSLPCVVNTSQCGEYHSLKWYQVTPLSVSPPDHSRLWLQDDVRVGVYSPHRNWYRLETDLKDVKVEAGEEKVSLTWTVGGEEEEGDYKCEITYLAVTPCPVVRLISNLVVVRPAQSVQLYCGGEEVTNSSLAPSPEGSQVRLECRTSGGRPPPTLTWYVGQTRTRATSLTNHSTTLHINITRDLLNQRVVCVVTSQAGSQTRVLSASVSLDLNLSPVSTVIRAEVEQEPVVSGSTLQLVCQTEGARPAASLQWLNSSAGQTTELRGQRTQQIATLQSDGTYVTLSKLVLTARSDSHSDLLRNSLANYERVKNTQIRLGSLC